MAVFTSPFPSGGGKTAGRPRDSIQSSPGPAGAVVEMLILILFNFFKCGLERFTPFTLHLAGDFTDQLPIQMVLGLGQGHTLGRYELSTFRRPFGQRHFHGDASERPMWRSTSRPGLAAWGLEPELLQQHVDDLGVVPGLGRGTY